MSVDLAVWEGPTPASDAEASKVFEELYARHIESGDETQPTERIAAYVAALLARFPDLTELDDEAIDDNPWADGPLINNAIGPFIYFSLVTNEAVETAWTHSVATARSMGLVAFDPQSGALAQ